MLGKSGEQLKGQARIDAVRQHTIALKDLRDYFDVATSYYVVAMEELNVDREGLLEKLPKRQEMSELQLITFIQTVFFLSSEFRELAEVEVHAILAVLGYESSSTISAYPQEGIYVTKT